MAKVTCGKCGGSGQYRFFTTGRVEACFPCTGTGRVEARMVTARVATACPERIELDLRAILANARAGRTSFDDVCGGTMDSLYEAGQFAYMLDSVSPKAREAFRAIGWPV